jgi:cephalosporin hydroxylase
MDRPLTGDSGAFESYVDFFFHSFVKGDAKTTWMGKKALKLPLDVWVYQEIIHEIKPDLIVEIGNAYGGGALFLANVLDLEENGKVLAIDLDHSKVDFSHPRIHWITGDANTPAVISEVKSKVPPGTRVMIIEDSSHTYENTLSVLRNYCEFVSIGSYFIVEDGVCRYSFVDGPKPGPFEATHTFLKENSDFVVDKTREKFVLTYNPDGYLKRIK